jgi:hypothetical protein
VQLPKKANIINSQLVIDWGHEHVSHYALKFLTSKATKKQDEMRVLVDRRKMNYLEMPTISYDDYMNDPIGEKGLLRVEISFLRNIHRADVGHSNVKLGGTLFCGSDSKVGRSYGHKAGGPNCSHHGDLLRVKIERKEGCFLF